MNPVLKFALALIGTFGFFAFWDRAEITRYRAASYNESASAYKAKGDLDRAIADSNEAIRLNPKSASAHINRGNTYEAKGDLERAIADYSEAIGIRPKSATGFHHRGYVQLLKRDFERAIADYDEVIRRYPEHAAGYLNRGFAFFYNGSVAKARSDFALASRFAPKDAYAALWLDLANRRDNLPSQLTQAATLLDMTAWPAPIVKLFFNETTSLAVLAATVDANPEAGKGRLCEANFFIGQLALLQKAKEEALRLFRLAASDCPRSFVQGIAAHAELLALDAKP